MCCRYSDVIVFHVHDGKTERNFEFEDKTYEFKDLESGEVMKLNPASVAEEIEPLLNQQIKEVEIKCGMAGIDYLEIDINMPLDQVLVPFLKRRKKRK